MNKKEIQNAILQAVDTVVENKLKNLKFNYYVDGVIKSVNSDGTYNVLINDSLYNNIPSQSKFTYSVGSVVQILIKNGDWNKKFIDDKISHNESPTINNGIFDNPQINNGASSNLVINNSKLVYPQTVGQYYYSNSDNDETALNAWLDELLNNMPVHSMQPVTISCYPAVSGVLLQGFLFKNTNDYASLSLRTYSSTTMEKVKNNGVWGNVRQIPTMVGASAYAVDYVTEQGTSGIWTYRKWESGKIEIHGNYSQGYINCDRAYGSVYISAMLAIALPSIDFTIKSVSIDVDLIGGIGGVCIANNNDYSGNGISYFIWHATSRSNFNPVLDVYITGTWK